jgi:hypothetical protein
LDWELWDSGLHSYGLAVAVRQHGAHFLSRVPRARKRPSCKYAFRKRRRDYQITPLAPFRDRITLHAPPLPLAA